MRLTAMNTCVNFDTYKAKLRGAHHDLCSYIFNTWPQYIKRASRIYILWLDRLQPNFVVQSVPEKIAQVCHVINFEPFELSSFIRSHRGYILHRLVRSLTMETRLGANLCLLYHEFCR